MSSDSWSIRQWAFVDVLTTLSKRGRGSPELQRALAAVPMLTTDFMAHPAVRELLDSIGLTKRTMAQLARHRAEPTDPEIAFNAGFNGDPAADELSALFKAALIGRQHAAELQEARRDELARSRSSLARRGADARHQLDRERAAKVRALWATGEFRYRDECAQRAESDRMGKFDTLRKALKGAPNPSPWPARLIKVTKNR